MGPDNRLVVRFFAALSYTAAPAVWADALAKAENPAWSPAAIDLPPAQHYAAKLQALFRADRDADAPFFRASAAALRGDPDPADETPPSSTLRAILAALTRIERMTSQTQTSLAALAAAESALAAEVDQLIAKVEADAAGIASAVSDALKAAGVDDATNAAAVDAATAKADTLVANIKAALAPPAPPPATLSLSPLSISGTAGVALDLALVASGGQEPYSFAADHALPPDITIDAAGHVGGTPTGAEAGDFGVSVTDANGATADFQVAYSITAPPQPAGATG